MRTDQLINDLATDLRPVRRLPGATIRTLCWLAPLLLSTATLLWGLERPDALEALGIKLERGEMAAAAATSVFATFAALSACKPDRPLWISYLPVPFVAAWLEILIFGISAQGHGRVL